MDQNSSLSIPLKNQPLLEYVRQHTEQAPEHTAVVFGDRRWTYRELLAEAGQLAAYLADRGVSKGSHVALFMQNSPQFVISSLAIQWLGGVVCPCNPMFKAWELEYQLNDLGAEVLITFDDQLPVFAEAGETKVQTVIRTLWADVVTDQRGLPVQDNPDAVRPDLGSVTVGNWADIVLGNAAVPETPLLNLERDPALIIYTSGTTGKPKGATLSYRNAEFKTGALVHHFGFTADDVFCSVMPIFHIAGMVVGMNSPLMVGGTIVIESRFDPQHYLETVRDQHPTILYTTPPMLLQLLDHPLATADTFRSVRMHLGTSFGIQISRELSQRWEAVGGTPYFEWAYGMSEAHTGNTLMPLDGIRYGNHGKPAPDTVIRIADPEDHAVERPVGELGEILIKSPAVFLGYLNRPEATAEVMWNGYYCSGDLGRIDEDGYLHFEGRTKEMIKCSGYSVFPEEVEAMLTRHEDIIEAAVIGVPDANRGESVKAFIVRAEGAALEPEEVVRWAKDRMAAYKYPREVEFVDELPKTTTGKLQRVALRTSELEKRQG